MGLDKFGRGFPDPFLLIGRFTLGRASLSFAGREQMFTAASMITRTVAAYAFFRRAGDYRAYPTHVDKTPELIKT
jgi:hypothetical protein